MEFRIVEKMVHGLIYLGCCFAIEAFYRKIYGLCGSKTHSNKKLTNGLFQKIRFNSLCYVNGNYCKDFNLLILRSFQVLVPSRKMNFKTNLKVVRLPYVF